jgi:hypothetical protein
MEPPHGVRQIIKLKVIVLVNMLAIAEFMRFLFNRKTYIGWQGYVGLLFTSTLFCSMAYGAGRLAAYICDWLRAMFSGN